MITMILIFLAKMLDNILATYKTILIQKGKGIQASITVFISSVIFFKLIDQVVTSNGDLAVYTISLAAALGTLTALKVNNKLSKDRLYVNLIMSDDMESMLVLRDYLMENRITNLVTDSYTRDLGKTLAITVYAQTKDESRKLSKFIERSSFKYKRVVTNN